MKKSDLRDLNMADIDVKIEENQSKLQKLRFQKALQQLDHPTVIRTTRRDIARINTRITFLNKQGKPLIIIGPDWMFYFILNVLLQGLAIFYLWYFKFPLSRKKPKLFL